MKVELHINGRLSIELTPETEIEGKILEEMVGSAEKGKAIKLEWKKDGGVAVVGVDK